jgi:heme/copper-type cytochrome/quinol oxidase subunit 2
MWGYISTEASYQLNFNVGFSTTRSDVLVHLAQWQYWWWFWFAFLWSFYYLVATRVVRYRSLKMRPKMSTSFRPHGKWGDFLAAIIPAIWCLNILTNSNFILRLIEWQNESSLFTIRVRARQWYWIYKFELKNFTDILTIPKNVGYNRWCVNTFGDLQVAEDYLYILQLRSQNKWVKGYWSEVLQKTGGVKKNHIVAPQEQLRLEFKNQSVLNTNLDKLSSINLDNSNLDFNLSNSLFNKDSFYFFNNDPLVNYTSNLNLKKSLWEAKEISELSYNFSNTNLENLGDLFFEKNYLNSSFKKYSLSVKSIFKHTFLFNTADNNLNIYSDFIESSRSMKRTQGINLPLRIVKYPFGLDNTYDTNYNLETLNLFNLKFNDVETSLKHKTVPNSSYFSIKQKRYTKKGAIPSVTKYVKDADGNKTTKVRYAGKPILFNKNIFEQNLEDPIVLYRLLQKNKKRSELIPINLARRIIRTKRTLVLPAHINITLITNSFDIVHSWFIPGLGIKLDCVPGRSTHHTFYVDNVGFYYGQCAEICGRYHHHMPIRVCALPFEHFLVWWYNFGLPKFLFTTSQKRYGAYYAFRKYVW